MSLRTYVNIIGILIHIRIRICSQGTITTYIYGGVKCIAALSGVAAGPGGAEV